MRHPTSFDLANAANAANAASSKSHQGAPVLPVSARDVLLVTEANDVTNESLSSKDSPIKEAIWNGAKPLPMAISVGLGLIIRYVIPKPAHVTLEAWSMLALFASTVCGVVTQPLPAPGVTFCGLAVGLLTGLFTFKEGVSAFTDEVLWLALLAFFFSKGFSKTGLGDRVALTIVRLCGGTTVGLAYGLNSAEGLLAAAMPSSAARAAGIFFPLVDSVAKASGSDPSNGTEKRTGAFLLQCVFQATGNSSSLWLYGAAQNLLILRLASQLGYEVHSPFTSWLTAMSMPALAAMILTPLVIYLFLPPEVKATPEAPADAQKRLSQMGPMSRDEMVLSFVVFGMLVLWAGSTTLGIPAIATAVLGLVVLLVSGTLTWDECAGDKNAWTTMTWFAILVSLSAMLNKSGIVTWFAASISKSITAQGLSEFPAFMFLLCIYTYSHYFFASQVAHVSALYVPFVEMMVHSGTPPQVAIFALAVASNGFAGLTPYSSAQAPVFFGGGYVTQKDWYKLGFITVTFNFMVWTIVAGVWWRIIGLY
jgi:DASS family divalent anion:Na+ symporter